MSFATESVKVPAPAGPLGLLGVVPFLGLAAPLPFLANETRLAVAHALVGYAATILSFLGGVHWGLAIAGTGNPRSGSLTARLILSVLPPLVGWISLLLPASAGLVTLSAAIAMMLWADIRATRAGEAPPWYPKLRIPLTCAVAATLLFGGLG